MSMDVPPLNPRLSAWSDAPAVAGDGVSRFDYISCVDGLSDWGVLIPGRPGGDLAVVLHGHGSHGDQLLKRVDIRDVWLPALRKAGLTICCPNLRDNAWMSPAAVADLNGLIQWAKRQYNPGRVFMIGGSMGGTSALIYAVHHPEQLDGVLSLCPAADLPAYWRWATARGNNVLILGEIADAIAAHYQGTPDQSPELFSRHSALLQYQRLTMPVAMAHGTADPTIPIEAARQLAHLLRERVPLHWEEIPGGGHDSPIPLLPSLLDWLLNAQ